jgi:hypothetical protein
VFEVFIRIYKFPEKTGIENQLVKRIKSIPFDVFDGYETFARIKPRKFKYFESIHRLIIKIFNFRNSIKESKKQNCFNLNEFLNEMNFLYSKIRNYIRSAYRIDLMNSFE